MNCARVSDSIALIEVFQSNILSNHLENNEIKKDYNISLNHSFSRGWTLRSILIYMYYAYEITN